MSLKIYQKENNLFQSQLWLEFQMRQGCQLVRLGEMTGIEQDIPLGQKFIWVQRGPERLSLGEASRLKKIGKNLTFVRLEPGQLEPATIKSLGLRPVSPRSLLSGQASPKATRVLDLTKTEEELLAAMKPKTRYNIRLAEKKGVTVRKSDDPECLYEMLLATSKKGTGYFPHQKSYYVNLMKDLGPSGIASIYVAEAEGEPLAAIMVTHFGTVATYLHGGQNDKARNLMAPYLCQWAAIKEAKAAGCETYDFWGVAESEDPADPWAGITRFKEGFGGEKIILPGAYDLVLKPFWYGALTLAARVKHLIRRR